MSTDRPPSTPNPHRTVRDVLGDHALLLAEADLLDEAVFGGVVIEECLFVDGRIDYTLTHHDGRTHTCPAHLVALLDTVDRRLVWPWDAPAAVAPHLTELPDRIRSSAATHGPAELVEGPHAYDAQWNPRQLVEAARALGGLYPLRLRNRTPDGRWQAAFVLDTPWTRLPEPTVASVHAAVLAGLDHRLGDLTARDLVAGYGRTREGLEMTEEGTDIVLRPVGGGRVRVRFDPAGQVLDVDSGGDTMSLHDVVDDAVYLSAEHQIRLEEVVGSRVAVSVDLAAGTLILEPSDDARSEPLVCAAHQLGTSSEETRDWLWAWARSGERYPGRERSAEVREFGRVHGIAPFVQQRVPSTEFTNGWVFEIAAKPVLGIWTAVSCATTPDRTVRGHFLVDHPELRPGSPSSSAFGRAVAFAGTAGRPRPRDTRRALESYCRFRGVGLRWTDPDRCRCEIDFGGGDVCTVELDGRGRIARLDGAG